MKRRAGLFDVGLASEGAERYRRLIKGAEFFIIANADTVMSRPNDELIAEVFPSVALKGDIGANETLISIAKARRLLCYEPQHGWCGA